MSGCTCKIGQAITGDQSKVGIWHDPDCAAIRKLVLVERERCVTAAMEAMKKIGHGRISMETVRIAIRGGEDGK